MPRQVGVMSVSEELCLFPGTQCKQVDSPAEVALLPFIRRQKPEPGNLLQRREQPGHKPHGSLRGPQDPLGQPCTNTKCGCEARLQELQGRDLCFPARACTQASVLFYFS